VRRYGTAVAWEQLHDAEEGAIMESEEIYFATRKVFATYAAFFVEVASTVGIEKALTLHERVHERLGMGLAQLLSGPCHPQCELETLRELLVQNNRSLGMTSEVLESTPDLAVIKNDRCPMFDGYWMGGADEQTARLLCEHGCTVKLSTALGAMNPHIEHRVASYRASSEDACLEEIRLRR
jgi:hypothetical protein